LGLGDWGIIMLLASTTLIFVEVAKFLESKWFFRDNDSKIV